MFFYTVANYKMPHPLAKSSVSCYTAIKKFPIFDGKEKNMKKTVLWLATALLLALCFALAACGGGNSPAVTTKGDNTSEAPSVTTTEVPSVTTTEVPSATTTETPATTTVTTAEVTTTESPATTEPPIVDVMIGETLNAPRATQFSVSNVFASDMVVQRGEHIRVWGWANPSQNGNKVTGEFKGMFAEAIIENGEWVITFGARLDASAETGHTMKIYGDGVSYEFRDVLVGDVYMVIGQSNCAYSVEEHLTYNDTPEKGGKDALDYGAPIRLHYNSMTQTAGYPKRGTELVCKKVRSDSTWQRADSYEDIRNFTAIGYYFAYNYLKLTDNKVPVGLIEIDGNGQPLGAFMCNEVAKEKGTDSYDESKGYYVTTGVNANWGRYLYNHYMYPFERYAIAGVLWYQGESDFSQENAKVFVENFSALMTYMRGTHNLINKDFPVYFFEFPTMYKQPTDFRPSEDAPQWAYMDIGLIRSVMGSIPRTLSNSYQIVSSDVWTDNTFWNNLHPNCKFEQSVRAAVLAAAVNGEGGKTLTQGNGPVLVSMEVLEGGKKAILTYENVGEGLKTSDGGTAVNGFLLYRPNCSINKFVTVTATITATNQITVECETEIEGLAYNGITTNFFGKQINLCNSEGVPAGATVILKDAD